MIYERIQLDPNDENIFLDTYAVNNQRIKPRDAMLIMPGGAYHGLSEREAEPIAFAYLANGINAFVLHYGIDESAVFPSQLLNAASAFKHIKENAEKYHINPNRIFVIGFSAGGHLAGSLLTLHKLAEEKLSLPENYLKPRGAVLSYPVITAYDKTHSASFANLFKKPFSELSEEEKTIASIEKNITAQTSPAFIWHTSEDRGVPIHGSLRVAEAYYNVGTPVELHIYPYGPHGVSLAREHTIGAYGDGLLQPRAEAWLSDSVKWIEGLDN